MSSPLNVMKSYTSILAGICIPVRLPSVPNDLTVRTEGSIARGQSLAQSFHLLWHSFRDLTEEKMITILTRLVFRARGQSSRKRTILKSQRARFCINARENPFVADVAVRKQVNGGADVRPVPRFSHDGWFISLLSASRLARSSVTGFGSPPRMFVSRSSPLAHRARSLETAVEFLRVDVVRSRARRYAASSVFLRGSLNWGRITNRRFRPEIGRVNFSTPRHVSSFWAVRLFRERAIGGVIKNGWLV